MVNPNIGKIGFGSRPREVDDEYRSRIGGVPRPRVWTREKFIEELDDAVTRLRKIVRDDDKVEKDNPRKLKQESIRDLNTLINRILEIMKYLYPPVQTNLNVNVDMTVDAVIERLKNWKKKKEENKEVIIVEEQTKNE